MKKYDPQKHHRRSIRLKGYDYRSSGAYFITICTQRRECVLDDPVVSGIIRDVWNVLPRWFPTVMLDEFVIMPNHVHFILWIRSVDVGAGVGASPAPTGCPGAVAPNGAGASPAPTGCPDAVAPPDKWIIPEPQRVNLNPRVGDVVGAFQSLVFKVYFDWIRIHDPTRRAKFWQRNYYEHIVRDERELKAIREYIRRNPAKWHADRDNADNIYHLAPPTTVEEYVREAMENA